MSKLSARIYNCSLSSGDLVKSIYDKRVGVVLKIAKQTDSFSVVTVLWADNDVGSVPKANLIKIKGVV